MCSACLQFHHVGGKSSFIYIAGLRQPDLYKILPRTVFKGRLEHRSVIGHLPSMSVFSHSQCLLSHILCSSRHSVTTLVLPRPQWSLYLSFPQHRNFNSATHSYHWTHFAMPLKAPSENPSSRWLFDCRDIKNTKNPWQPPSFVLKKREKHGLVLHSNYKTYFLHF